MVTLYRTTSNEKANDTVCYPFSSQLRTPYYLSGSRRAFEQRHAPTIHTLLLVFWHTHSVFKQSSFYNILVLMQFFYAMSVCFMFLRLSFACWSWTTLGWTVGVWMILLGLLEVEWPLVWPLVLLAVYRPVVLFLVKLVTVTRNIIKIINCLMCAKGFPVYLLRWWCKNCHNMEMKCKRRGDKNLKWGIILGGIV